MLQAVKPQRNWLLLVGMYRSLVKKGPVSNIRPPPYFALISCKSLKFTLKSAHLVDLARVKIFTKDSSNKSDI